MNKISPSTALMVIISVIAQLFGIYMLPRTRGLTNLPATLIFAASYAVALGILARVVYRGVDLGLLVPAMAAIIPLLTIGIGIVAYGESAAPLKLVLLVGACVAVGIASAISV